MRRLSGKGAKKKKDWLNENDPEGTFVNKLTPEWLKREVGSQIPLEIRPWRSLSTRILRWFVHPKFGGKLFCASFSGSKVFFRNFSRKMGNIR